MSRTLTRVLALAAISATTMLTLTACGAGTGNNSAPNNDQSSPTKVAESYFQDISHLDTAKLSALLTKPLTKAQQAEMSATADAWGKTSPYTDFHVASVKKEYDGNGYDHKASVYFTYKFNEKLIKSSVYVEVDPEIDDKVWMIDGSATSFNLNQGTDYAIKAVSNTVTINKKNTKVGKNTLVFPGVPYTQTIKFYDNLFTPVTIHGCGSTNSQETACANTKTIDGKLDTAEVSKRVLASFKAKVGDVVNHAPLLSGDDVADDNNGKRSAASFLGSGPAEVDSQQQAAYDAYAKNADYYKPLTDPKVEINDYNNDFDVTLVGGTYQAYDFISDYTDNGCRPGSETVFGCNDPIRTYNYKSAWDTYDYEGWMVNVSKTGEITKIVADYHDDSDVLS